MTSCTHSPAPPACGCTRHPQCKPVSTLRFELCQPMTAALPVDKRSLRQVAVLWAARASHRLLTPIVVVLRPKAQGCVNYLVCGQWGLASLWLRCDELSPRRLDGKAAAHELHPIVCLFVRPMAHYVGQSPSSSRRTAGAAGFLIFSQWADLPAR
jgi:hypothetical protein